MCAISVVQGNLSVRAPLVLHCRVALTPPDSASVMVKHAMPVCMFMCD